MAEAQIMTSSQPATKPSSDLRVPGLLAKWPVIGIIMILFGSLMFGALAYNVWTKGPLLQWDVPLSRELHNEAVQDRRASLNF